MLALGACGPQVVFALRAKIEIRTDPRSALRAGMLQRLPEQEVEDEPDAVGHKDNQSRPQGPIHSSPLGIAIHVADQQKGKTEERARKNRKQDLKRKWRRVLVAAKAKPDH